MLKQLKQDGSFGLQKNDNTYLLKINFLKIGDARFDNVITETDKNGVSRIGAKLLEYGAITLDFIHRRFYFEVINDKNDLNEKHWPFRPVIRIPKFLAKAGAWVQNLFGKAFIKPWMVDLADDHLDIDSSKAQQILGWKPQHSLRQTLPEMIARLKADPEKFYKENNLKK